MDCMNSFRFPFNEINDSEFRNLMLNYDIRDPIYDMNNVLITREIASHDDDVDSGDNSMLNNLHKLNKTEYITLEELNQLQTTSDSLNLLQINCRSLKKNLSQVKNLLMHFNDKPSIISLSESWIKQSDNLSVFAIHGYDFISNPRKKNLVEE